MTPATNGLWWRWLAWTTGGEVLGFCVPAVVAALTSASPLTVVLPAVLAAGAVEGALLGAAQAWVLTRALPGLPARRWATRTSIAAVVAWLIGMLPSTAGGGVSRWPTPLLVLAAGAGGAALLLSIGTAQWTVLRHHAPRATHWIWITALAWLAGLAAFMLVASPLWHEGQQMLVTVAVGVLAGVIMAATVAAITGAGLVRLLRVAGPASAVDRSAPDGGPSPRR